MLKFTSKSLKIPPKGTLSEPISCLQGALRPPQLLAGHRQGPGHTPPGQPLRRVRSDAPAEALEGIEAVALGPATPLRRASV